MNDISFEMKFKIKKFGMFIITLNKLTHKIWTGQITIWAGLINLRQGNLAQSLNFFLKK